MRLMILENKKLRTVMPVEGGSLSVGSSPSCTVHLPDPRLGAEHVRLSQDDAGTWWLDVLDTSVPTCLNRAVQKGRAKLSHADEVEMGAFSIRLFLEHKSLEELQQERIAALSQKHGENLPLGTIVRRFEHAATVAKDELTQLAILTMRVAQFEAMKDALPVIIRNVLRTLRARRAWMGVRRPEGSEFGWIIGLTDQGQPCDMPSFASIMRPRCLEQGQSLCCADAPAEGVRSCMAGPLVGAEGAYGMIYVENGTADPPYGESALDLLSAVCCAVAAPVETLIRKTAAKRQAVSSSEQTISRATQDAITPKALPQWNELQLAAYRRAGGRRCCDYYDVVQLPDKTCAVIVARLAIEGITLPRYLSEVRAAFRSAALHCDAPHLFARSLNWLLTGGEPRQIVDIATAWIAPASGKVNYCVAGGGVHVGVILPNGTCEKISPKRGESIGRTKNLALDLQTHDLGHGHSLVFATAGVESAMNAEGAAFGLAGLEDTLCDALGGAPGQVLGELAQDFDAFVEGGSCPDDVTVLLIRRA